MNGRFMQSELRGTAAIDGAGGSLFRLRSDGTVSAVEHEMGRGESHLLTSETLLTLTGDRSFQQVGTLVFDDHQAALNVATFGSGMFAMPGNNGIERLCVAINRISSGHGEFVSHRGLMAAMMLIRSDGTVIERQLLMLDVDRWESSGAEAP